MAQYGEKSITLDIKSEKGKEIFKRLVKDADVLIENFSPRVMPGLGLNYEILRGINPVSLWHQFPILDKLGPTRIIKPMRLKHKQ